MAEKNKPAKRTQTAAEEEYSRQVQHKLAEYEGLFEIFQELVHYRQVATNGQVVFYWNVGLRFADVLKSAAYGTKKGAAEALADALQINTDDLQSAIRVYKTFPVAEKLLDLLARENCVGKTLTWGHVRRLCSDSVDDKRRSQLIESWVEHAWSPAQLDEKIRNELDKPRGKGGRPHAPMRSLWAGLQKWDAMNRQVIDADTQVFAEDKLVAIIEATPADQLGPETLAQLGTVEKQVLDMVKLHNDQADRIRKAKRLVSQRIEIRDRANRAAEPEPTPEAKPKAAKKAAPAPKDEPKPEPKARPKAAKPKATKDDKAKVEAAVASELARSKRKRQGVTA